MGGITVWINRQLEEIRLSMCLNIKRQRINTTKLLLLAAEKQLLPQHTPSMFTVLSLR